MNTSWKKRSRISGEVPVWLLIVGAAVCVALYFFGRPKPAPPLAVAEATPAPVEATPAPATPPPVVVEEPPPPPPEPVAVVEPSPPVPTPPPLDLATVAKTPALWPKQVSLVQAVRFPVIVSGQPAGSVNLPAGTSLRLLRVAGAQVEVEYQNARQLISAAATDVMVRAWAASNAMKPPATELASAGTPPTPEPGVFPAPAAPPREATAPSGKVPGLRVQASVGTAQKRLGDSYKKEMTIKPKAVIEGTTQMVAIPPLKATMLVITMSTKAKYVAGEEAYSVYTAETQDIDATSNGARRNLTFGESKVVFDSWRDGTNLGGLVYKYYVFGLIDPATKAIVDFQTNSPELAAFCKRHPDSRQKYLDLKKGATFPARFD